MAEAFPVTGGCYCGQIRYQISAAPVATGICHCRSCRRTAGAESVGWAVLNDDTLTFAQGQPFFFKSSPNVQRSFCRDCGTTLTYRREGRALIDIALATLDDPERWPPSKETWCEHRLQWNVLNEALAHFAQGSSGAQLNAKA